LDDYPFLEIVWTMFIFAGLVLFVWLAAAVLIDNFARHDHSGWAKAAWTLLIIFLPVFGLLAYMIARPPGARVGLPGHGGGGGGGAREADSIGREIERLHNL
jgi:hypothetical protein